MAFDPGTLKLFLRIDALGAFGRAGREIGLSATATTQRIKRLETELGVTLFNRTTRAVSLTADGKVFAAHAQRILGTIEDARSDLSNGSADIQCELRVTSSASFGRRYIAPCIAEFLQAYPQVSVRLELSDGIVDIVEHGFDLALRIGTLAPSTLIARRLADNPRILVASPVYLQRAGTPQQPADLANHNCLVLAENRHWKLRDEAGQIHDIKVQGNFSANYGEMITEAALADVGIALKSVWDIHHLLRDGSLLSLLSGYSIEPTWSLWAVRPPGQMVPARVRVFLDFLDAKFNSQPG